MSHTLYLFSVFFHILASALWIGGMIFLITALIPAIKKNPDKVNLLYNISIRFRTAGWIALIILIITGWFQLYYRGAEFSADYFINNSFGKIALSKIAVALTILIISAIHDFKIGIRAMEEWKINPSGEKTMRLRNSSRILGKINFLLTLIAVALGVLLSRGL